MLKITGYADRVSARAGETIKFMVNCEHREYRADIVRIVSGDLNPEGPGVIEEAINTAYSEFIRLINSFDNSPAKI